MNCAYGARLLPHHLYISRVYILGYTVLWDMPVCRSNLYTDYSVWIFKVFGHLLIEF